MTVRRIHEEVVRCIFIWAELKDLILGATRHIDLFDLPFLLGCQGCQREGTGLELCLDTKERRAVSNK